MKRLLLVLAAALVWAILSPAPVSAGWWPFGHHSKAKSASADQPAAHKEHKEKAHHSFFRRHESAKQHGDPAAAPLYTSGPKSVGWWRKTPGPAGAGS